MMMQVQLLTLAVLALALAEGAQAANPGALPSFNIANESVTVGGLSSGAFMAVQMHVAFSSRINGASVFAGGPYRCGEGSLNDAELKCMYDLEGGPDLDQLFQDTAKYEAQGLIDPTENLKGQPVFLYSGRYDTEVNTNVVKAASDYYSNYGADTTAEYSVQSQHCFPTLDYGEPCTLLMSPYIGKCDYDGAGISLQALYGDLNDRVTAQEKNLISFDQTAYYVDGDQASLSDTGYFYAPTACQEGAECKLHVNYHGCNQGLDSIGTQYAANVGLNEWAESNNIVVLYPYVDKSRQSPSNGEGCWDWWGEKYTGESYAWQTGTQMQFSMNLINALMGIE